MRFLSVCSGIEAASLAWNPLGWEAVAFAEIEPFPSAVLKHRFPHVPNLGDMTRHAEWDIDGPDVLVGGTPCQSFSVAGLRAGMDDPRGNLALVFLEIARRLRPRWVVWENVPGVLSSAGGRDFGSFLGGLVECGYGFAYRVLDAQFAGVPQRRRRVFVVGHLGDWRRAAAVLLERSSLQGHPPPRREAGEVVAGCLEVRTGGGGIGTDFACDGGLQPVLARALRGQPNASHRADSDTYVAHTLGTRYLAGEDGTGRGTPLVPQTAPCLTSNYGKQPDNSNTSAGPMLVAHTLRASGFDAKGGSGRSDGETETFVPMGFHSRQDPISAPVSLPLEAKGGQSITSLSGVRRLTPRECERLQGMPDDWTLVPYRGKPASDGARYKAIGNSIAVPVLRWIGERMERLP